MRSQRQEFNKSDKGKELLDKVHERDRKMNEKSAKEKENAAHPKKLTDLDSFEINGDEYAPREYFQGKTNIYTSRAPKLGAEY